MIEEIWKDIPWYFWNYKVSNLWRIKNYKWVMNSYKKLNGYVEVDLYMLWNRKKTSAHRLVAQSFLWLNLEDSSVYVCHKDDNPSNNCVDNLFLGTAKDNMRDMINKWRDINNFKLNNPNKWKFWKDNKSSKKISQFTLDNLFIREWSSWIEMEKETWINNWNVSSCCSWKKKTAWWFIWKYSN